MYKAWKGKSLTTMAEWRSHDDLASRTKGSVVRPDHLRGHAAPGELKHPGGHRLLYFKWVR